MVTAGFGQVGKTHSYCGFLVFQLGWNLVETPIVWNFVRRRCKEWLHGLCICNFWRWFWFCDSLKSEEIHMNSCFLSAAVCCSSWGYLPSPSEFDNFPSLKRLENFYTDFNADSEYCGWLRVSTLTWWEILGRVAGPPGRPKQDPSWPPSIPIKIGRQPVEGMTTWTVHNFLRWFRMCKPLESEEIHLIQCSKSVH